MSLLQTSIKWPISDFQQSCISSTVLAFTFKCSAKQVKAFAQSYDKLRDWVRAPDHNYVCPKDKSKHELSMQGPSQEQFILMSQSHNFVTQLCNSLRVQQSKHTLPWPYIQPRNASGDNRSHVTQVRNVSSPLHIGHHLLVYISAQATLLFAQSWVLFAAAVFLFSKRRFLKFCLF